MRNKRQTPSINAGSMADIAFLLLIFWLVATTITPEYGWENELKSEDEDPKIAVVTNNAEIVKVYLKEDGTIDLNGKASTLEQVEITIQQVKNRAGYRGKLVLTSDYKVPYRLYSDIEELAKKLNIKIIYNEI